ncbi:MAG: LptF/LptG family permease [Akkermansia sp.]
MGILDRYIGRQILGVTILGVAALSTLLLLGNLFKELRPMLIDSGAPASIVVEFIFQVIPFSLMFSIPWGFLTAILLVYGRLAADNELTSMRMAGQSLLRLSAPALVIATILSGFCYWVNADIAPQAKQAISDIIIRAASVDPKGLLREGQAITKFDDQEIYIDQRQGDIIYGMHIYQQGKNNMPGMTLHSKRVDVSFDEKEKVLHFDLNNTFVDMNEGNGISQVMLVDQMPWRISVDRFNQRRKRANRFTNAEIHELLADPNSMADNVKARREFETEIPRRASFSVACIAFALMGVPLAISARRKDTSSGFALGILIAALYFIALVFADLSRKSGGPLPYILLWLPNIISLIVAYYLHKRAQRVG